MYMYIWEWGQWCSGYLYIYMYTYKCKCIKVYIDPHAYAQTQTHTHKHANTHTHTHTHMLTYIYSHTDIPRNFCVVWGCIYTCTHSHMWEMTHLCVGHDSFVCGTWLIHMWDMTLSYVGHDPFICGPWLTHVWDMTHSYVGHDSFVCVTWLIRMCDMTHVTHMNDAIQFCDYKVSIELTFWECLPAGSEVRRFRCVGVVTMSRCPKSICLFC